MPWSWLALDRCHAGARHGGARELRPAAAVEDLDGAAGQAHVDLLPDQGVWHGVEEARGVDMIVEIDPGELPLGIFVVVARQYELVEVARRRGFRDVEIIDDDLGRSASGAVARPGFERLVAWLCAGEIGAVLCFDASRLARNGRDWHHLLELCGLVEARVIDLDGVYDPCQPNDRLLLGMKGSISEFELGVLRARMLDAARAKAHRASCASACRSATAGIAKPGWVSIPTCGCRR